MRTEYIFNDELEHVLALLMPSNRLACQLALKAGLRIGDVLSIKTADLKQRMSIKEKKTGKTRRISMSKDLLLKLQAHAGLLYVFPSRSGESHRTRQAVWKDLKRAQEALRLPGNIGTHTMRKVYAVRLMKRYGSIKKVMDALNHDNETTTLLYAMADLLTEQRLREGGKLRTS